MMSKRALAILIAILLAAAAIPETALMEFGAEPGSYDAADADASVDLPLNVAQPDDGVEEMAGFELDDGLEAAAEDETGEALEAEGFVEGYARVIEDGVEPEDVLGGWQGALCEGDVVYAKDIGDGQCEICFDTASGIVDGFVSAADIQPLTADEAEAFIDDMKAMEDVRFLDDEKTLPLMRLGEPAGATVAASDAVMDAPLDNDDEDSGDPVKNADAEPGDPIENADADPDNATEDDDAAPVDADTAKEVPGDQQNDADEAGTQVEPADPSSSDEENQAAPSPDDDPSRPQTEGEAAQEEHGEAADEAQEDLPALAGDEEMEEPADETSLIGVHSVALHVGESIDIAPVDGGSAEALTWSIEDESVATVDERGRVSALAVGETSVTAVADDRTDTCAIRVTGPASSIRFEVSALTLGVKETSDALCRVVDQDGVEVRGGVTYTSGKASVAAVDDTGRVRALKRGSAKITARLGDLTAKCSVTVKKAPSGITPSPKSIVLGVGETAEFHYKLSAGSVGSVTATPADTSIATVNGGVIKGESVGNTTITLETYNHKTDEISVEVKRKPQSVTFRQEEIVIGVGEKFVLSADTDEGSASALKFDSVDASIASVSGNTIVGVAVGETKATVSTYNDVEGTCTVIVRPAPTSISLNYTSTKKLGVGNVIQIVPDLGEAAGKITYKSSNKKVAKVDADGTVTALKKGSATITVSTYNKTKPAKLKLKVYKAPKRITVTEEAHSLGVGERFRLGYKLSSGSAGTVSFEAVSLEEDEKPVVDVDPEKGDIVGLAVGSAEVRVRTYNGHEDVCVVTVCPPPQSIKLESELLDMGVKETHALKCSLLPEGSSSALTYKSSNKKVATVSASGVIKAKAKGTATITVSTYLEDVWTTVQVRVLAAPRSVKVKPSSTVILMGETYPIIPILPSNTHASYTYKSSNPKVAVVDRDGVVTGIKRGKATITIKTHNGKKTKLKVTVYDPSYPEIIELLEPIPILNEGGKPYQIKYRVIPETATEFVTWQSNLPETATVDDYGLVSPTGFGYATLTAVSQKNSKVALKALVGVQNEDYTLIIPERITAIDSGEISANRKKIAAIRTSALNEIERLRKAKQITSADASRRREIVENVFKSYDFPWITPYKQLYWKAKNSEKGRKDFKPGQVYYGLPYISGLGGNRTYNVAGAMDKIGGYKDTGNGYYKLHKLTESAYKKRSYKGCDCSGLCDTAIWGMGAGARSKYRTDDIASSSLYRKVSKSDLRPGDLICKSKSHVVMFLYYCGPLKDRIMIIENGGSELGTNTVHCSVMKLSTYKKYKGLRVSSLG